MFPTFNSLCVCNAKDLHLVDSAMCRVRLFQSDSSSLHKLGSHQPGDQQEVAAAPKRRSLAGLRKRWKFNVRTAPRCGNLRVCALLLCWSNLGIQSIIWGTNWKLATVFLKITSLLECMSPVLQKMLKWLSNVVQLRVFREAHLHMYAL